MSSRSVGAFLIAAAVVVAFALGLEAEGAEPDKPVEPVKVDDSKAPPQPALSIEREGEKFTALKIHGPDGKVLAIMWPDGRVDTVNGTPPEAARAFWQAFSGYVQQCQALAAQTQAPAKTEK